jgi:hypothetical protein
MGRHLELESARKESVGVEDMLQWHHVPASLFQTALRLQTILDTSSSLSEHSQEITALLLQQDIARDHLCFVFSLLYFPPSVSGFVSVG